MKFAMSMIIGLLLAAPAFAQRDETRATVLQPAPIMLLPDPNRQPLRIAAQGSSLVVMGTEGTWTQVQFQDPQFGPRVGYIESRFIRIAAPTLTPVDLSVPVSPATSASAGAQQPSGPGSQQLPPAPKILSANRRGFWFNVGMGYGSAGAICDGCDARANGFSGGLSMGGTVGDGVNLIGIGTTGWARSVDGELATFGTFDFRYRTYFTPESNFSMQFGAGLGSASNAGFYDYGLGWMVGGSYDVRVGRNVSLSPFGNVFMVHLDGATLNNLQVGIGVTIH
jgi:hypothetical protein